MTIERAIIQPNKGMVPDGPGLADYTETRWYALYTCANRERRVADQLRSRGIEHFLPQYESLREWKDRKVRLQLPLFPGYVFVHLALQNRLCVLQIPGVAHIVGFGGRATPLADEDVARVRICLDHGFRAQPHRFLQVGRRVRVRSGLLTGLEGIIVRRKNAARFVISFVSIQRSIAVELDSAALESVVPGQR